MYQVLKMVLSILIMGIGGYWAEQMLPWWIIAVVSAVVCFAMHLRSLAAFICSFLGIGIMWMGVAWLIHIQVSAAMTEKISLLFGLQDETLLIVLTGCLGGLVGGMGGLSGSIIRNFRPRKKAAQRMYN